MQNLQTARLTAKPMPPQPPDSSRFSALRKAYDTSNRPPQVRATGILRQREVKPAPSQPQNLNADPRTVELLSRFLISQGIPFECTNEPTFRDLIKYLNPGCVIPPENAMNKFVEKVTCTNKSVVNYQKTVGPISVTIDMYGNTDEKYLAFSIHYFDDLIDRKTMVYLRKMMISQIDPESLLTTIRRAVNHSNFETVKFSNLVSPNEQISALIASSGVSKHFYVSFYQYITMFVKNLLQIEEFSTGLDELRTFVRFIKDHADLYGNFRRMQLSKNAELDVPDLDNKDWDTTATFLTRCLVLHETFIEFSGRRRLTTYITEETFKHLFYLHGLLDQCVKTCRKLSAPDNSISQLVPEIRALKRFIVRQKMGYRYQKKILDGFNQSFAHIIKPGTIQHQYDVAALMDPRYAYLNEVYSRDEWTKLEMKVTGYFVNTHVGLETNSYYQKIGQMDRKERYQAVLAEFTEYRRLTTEARPQDTDNPYKWWGDMQTQLEFLSVLAREYVACPAVTIDASYFFSDGGKFRHMCDTYSNQQLENCLNFAGSFQQFRGRGGSEDTITPEMKATLQSTANQLQNQNNVGLYAHGIDRIASDREVAKIIGHDYPPMSTAENKDVAMIPEVEEKPPAASTMLSSAQLNNRQVRPQARPVQLNGQTIGGRVFLNPPSKAPVSTREIPLPVKPLIPKPKGTPINPKTSNLGQKKPGAAPSEEQKPKDLLEKVIKQENEIPLLKDVKEEPVDEEEQPVKPQTVTSQLVLPVTAQSNQSTSQPFRIHPREGAPMPQNINPHNFVQPFAQKQKFVNKFGQKSKVPSELSERKPALKLQQERKPNELLLEASQTQREPKLEMLDDSGVGNASAEDAFIRHRASLQLQKPRTGYQRCAVCGHTGLRERFYKVTFESEKILIMLGCIYREEFTISQAKSFMTRQTKTYVCSVHFAETLDEIYTMLESNTPDDVLSCSLDLIQNALISVTALNPYITSIKLREMLHDFCEENKHFRKALDLAHSCLDDNQRFTSAGGSNDVDEQEIIPKVHRQPRKQVLEMDQHGRTFKVIEQENFKLPTVKSTENEDCENPGVCCFCSKRGDRSGMLKIPRGEDRLARWIEKLGPEFEARLQADQDNLICRSHFPEAAFSSRGRLLKGMIPDTAPEKVEVTYKIQGNSFLKLNEQKSGTDKNASIDLEKVQDGDDCNNAPSHSSAACHVPYVPYVPQNIWRQSNLKKSTTPSQPCGSKKKYDDDDEYVPDIPVVSSSTERVTRDKVVPMKYTSEDEYTDDEIDFAAHEDKAPEPSTAQPKRGRGRPPKRKIAPADKETDSNVDDYDHVSSSNNPVSTKKGKVTPSTSIQFEKK